MNRRAFVTGLEAVLAAPLAAERSRRGRVSLEFVTLQPEHTCALDKIKVSKHVNVTYKNTGRPRATFCDHRHLSEFLLSRCEGRTCHHSEG